MLGILHQFFLDVFFTLNGHEINPGFTALSMSPTASRSSQRPQLAVSPDGRWLVSAAEREVFTWQAPEPWIEGCEGMTFRHEKWKPSGTRLHNYGITMLNG